MKRALVTGGSGFVGRHCIEPLRARGYQVVAASSRDADLLRAGSAAELIARARPTHLLHLAWRPSVPGEYWTSPDNSRWVEATIGLLRAFAGAGERVIMVGSCAEYDWSAGVCCETDTPLRPQALYGESKRDTFLQTRECALSLGVSLAWARLFFLYGPHEHPQRLVASVIKALHRGERAACTTGWQRRDFLHVQDAADALATLLDSDLTGPVNIGSGIAPTVREVVEQIGTLMGATDRLDFGARPLPQEEPSLIVADLGRLRDELWWKPRIELAEGLSQTIAWWRAQ